MPKAQGTSPKERRQALHDAILEAARDLFFERSFAGVGVDELGARAGANGPAIYRHFAGKDEILATLFDDAIDELNDATAGEHADPREALAALVRGHVTFVLHDHRLAGIMMREERSLAPEHKRRVRRREQRYAQRWLDCLSRCYPQRDPDEIRTAMLLTVGGLNSIAAWPREVLADRALADRVVEQALSALRVLDR